MGRRPGYRQHKRKKVQKAYIERQLYKNERRIEKLSAEALAIRRALVTLDAQEAKVKKEREEAVNKSLHDASISAAKNTGGNYNASSRTKRTG